MHGGGAPEADRKKREGSGARTSGIAGDVEAGAERAAVTGICTVTGRTIEGPGMKKHASPATGTRPIAGRTAATTAATLIPVDTTTGMTGEAVIGTLTGVVMTIHMAMACFVGKRMTAAVLQAESRHDPGRGQDREHGIMIARQAPTPVSLPLLRLCLLLQLLLPLISTLKTRVATLFQPLTMTIPLDALLVLLDQRLARLSSTD